MAASVAVSLRTVTFSTIASNTTGFIQKVITMIILRFGARLVIEGRLTVGELVAFNMIAGRVSSSIMGLTQRWQEFQQAGVAVRELGDILNAVAEPAHTQGPPVCRN